MFFMYNQNNSGGNFAFVKDRITHYVIIEAEDKEDADVRAERVGIYFDGCSEGRDCECCGDRWSPTYGSGDKVPTLYGEPVVDTEMLGRWMGKNPEVYIHYLDGRVEGVTPKAKYAKA